MSLLVPSTWCSSRRTGVYGVPAPVRSQSQRSTVTPVAWSTASSTSLVFPFPGSPTTSTTEPDPSSNCSVARLRMAISGARPMSTSSAFCCLRGSRGPESLTTGTGLLLPFRLAIGRH